MKRTTYHWATTILLPLAFCACATLREHNADAIAVLSPTQGNEARGNIYFSRVKDGVRIDGEVTGLKPGPHGFHIHEKGDCSAPDAMSAGAHFNPAGNPHAGPRDKSRHNGDFGNIDIGQDGKGRLELVDDLLTVKPGPTSIVGKSVIFHEQTDDLKTQPAGNSGARLGCGVIQ